MYMYLYVHRYIHCKYVYMCTVSELFWSLYWGAVGGSDACENFISVWDINYVLEIVHVHCMCNVKLLLVHVQCTCKILCICRCVAVMAMNFDLLVSRVCGDGSYCYNRPIRIQTE